MLDYIERVHERTRRVVTLIPAADMDWAPMAGWFTLGGLVRHLAAIERWMYAENAAGRPSRYAGHGPELLDGGESVLAYYDRMHAETLAVLGALNDEAMERKVATPSGAPITLWKWLRAMIEHEAHHRGQLYLMLAMRGVSTPPVFGLTSEEVRARSEPGDSTRAGSAPERNQSHRRS